MPAILALVTNVSDPNQRWFVLKQPDGTYLSQLATGTTAASTTTFNVTLPGIYELVHVVNDPGNVSAPGYTLPTYIPLPTGTNFALTARMNFFNISPLTGTVRSDFNYQTNFVPYNCTPSTTGPNASYFVAGLNASVYTVGTNSASPTLAVTNSGVGTSNRNLIYDPINKAFIYSNLTDFNFWLDGAGNSNTTLRYNNTLGVQSSLSNYDMTTDGNGYYYWNTGGNNIVVIDARSQTSIYWLKTVLPSDKTQFDVFGSGVSMNVGVGATNTMFYYKGMLYILPTLSAGQIYEVNPATGAATLAYIDTSSFTTLTGGDGMVIIDDVAYIVNVPQSTTFYKVPLTFPFVPNQVFTASLVGNNSGPYGPADICKAGILINTAQNKTVSSGSAVLGSVLTYSVFFRNVSLNTITNIVLNDTIPPETTFVPGSLTINGAASSATPTTATLPDLGVGSGVTVTFLAIVTSIPAVNPITNTANINYILDSVPNTATTPGASTIIGNTPDFDPNGVVKYVDKTLAMVGDTLTYTVTITNSGTATALTPLFTDMLAPEVSLINSSISVGGTPTSGNLNTGITLPNLAPGVSITVSFKVIVTTVPSNLIVFNQGNLNYNFVVNGQTLSGSQSSNIVDTVILTSTNADLNKSTKYGPNIAYVGQTIVYTILIPNSGGQDALNTVMYDTLPSSLTFIPNSVFVNNVATPGNPATGINIGTIPSSGGTAFVVFGAIVNTLPNPNTITNTASFTYTDASSLPLTATTNTLPTQIFQQGANLSNISKTVDNQQPIVGTTITFTVSIVNTGGLPATNVVVLDSLPTGLNYVLNTAKVNGVAVPGDPNTGIQVGTVPVGTTNIITFTVLVSSVPNPNPYINVANVGYRDGNGNTVTIPVVAPAIAVIVPQPGDLSSSFKIVNNPTPSVGDTITYSIYAINTASSTITNLTIYDTLPSAITYVPNSAQVNGINTSGTPSTGIYVGTVPGLQYKLVTFQAVLTTIPSPNPFTNIATLNYFNGVTTITNQISGGQINVTKSGGANLGTTLKGANSSSPKIGDIVTYTITIPNTSSVPATNVTLLDILPSALTLLAPPTIIGASGVPSGSLTVPPGYNIGTVFGNSTALVIFQVLVNTIPVPNPYTNTVTITYTDPTGTSTLPSTGGNLNVSPSGGANISGATKGNNAATASVGQIITYSLTIPNVGNQAATNVTVLDILPTGLSLSGTPVVTGITSNPTGNLTVPPGLNIGTIPAGSTAVVTFNILVNAVPNPSTFINTATVTYTDNNGTSTIPVTGPTGGTPISPSGGANLGTTVKGASASSPTVGSNVSYTITIPNTSTVPAGNVIITDILPSAFNIISGPTVTGNIGTPSGNLSTGFNIGTIPANTTAIVGFVINITTIPVPNPYINTVTIVYTDPTGTSTLPATGGNLNVLPGGSGGGNLGNTTKTVNNGNPAIGSTVTYTIAIPNTGKEIAQNVTVTDVFPAGLSVVGTPVVTGNIGTPSGSLATGLNIGSIAIGGTAIVTFQVLVSGIPTPNPYQNQATISYTDSLGNHTFPAIGGALNVGATNGANLGTSVKTSNTNSPQVGDIVTYTVTVPNLGPAVATNVTVLDLLTTGINLIGAPVVSGSSGPISGNLTVSPGLNIGSIAVGASAVITFKVAISTIPNPNPFLNKINITYTDPTGTNTNVVSGGNLNVSPASGSNLSGATKGQNKNSAAVGDIITYTISIPNTGTLTALNVNIVDTLPAGLSLNPGSIIVSGASGPVTGDPTTISGLTIGSIAPNTTAVVTFGVLVNAVPNPSSFSNKATITYTDSNGKPGVVITPPTPPVTITPGGSGGGNLGNTTKTVNNGNPAIGSTVTYTIAIPNTGKEIAQNVTVTDVFPAGLSVVGTPVVTGNIGTPSGNLATGLNIGSIAVGGTAIVTFQVLISGIPTPNPYQNQATISYTDSLGNHTFPAIGGALNVGGTNGANLGKSVKTSSTNSPQVGDIVTYTVTVPNLGPAIATNVTILDLLPTGINLIGTPVVTGSSGPVSGNLTVAPGLNIGSIAVGASAVITFKVAINAIPTPNPFLNKVSITYTDPTGTHTNVVSGGNLNVSPAGGSNLTGATKNGDKAYAAIGDVINYTINIPNSGSLTALNVNVLDLLPAGLVLSPGSVSVTGASGPIVGNPTALPGLNIGSINPGVTATVKFGILVSSIPNPASFTNKATITYTDSNGKPGGVVTPPTTTDINSPDFTNENFVKSADKQYADIGDTITYTFKVKNNGNVAANNVMLQDPLSSVASFINGSLTVNNIAIPSGNITLGVNLGTIAPSQSVTVTFKAVANSIPVGGILSNQGNLNYKFTKDPSIPNGASGSASSNIVNVNINSGKLGPNNVSKTSSSNLVSIGDILTFTVNIQNPGNRTITNVLVTDLLDPTLQFISGSAVSNGITLPLADVTSGIPVADIAPGASATVTFKVKVIGASTNPIINKAVINYKYIVDPTKPPVTASITATASPIYNANIVGQKTASTDPIIVGQSFNYTITLTNKGNIKSDNTFVKDVLPASFTVLGVTVNGNSVSVDPNAGFYIGGIDIGNTTTIVMNVVAKDTVNINSFTNTATVTSTFTPDPTKPPVNITQVITGGTNNVINSKLKMTKSSNVNYAAVGDTITYTVIAQNTGNVDLLNVNISDNLSNGLEFVEGSLTINTESYPTYNIIAGIMIPTIPVGKTVTITYESVIISAGTLPNQATGVYQYEIKPNAPLMIGNSNSNINTINAYLAQIKVTKTSNTDFALLGDVINYTVILRNVGGINAFNVVFKDDLPRYLQLVPGSFTVNNKVINNVDLSSGVNIGKINVNQVITIHYSAKVISNSCSSKIINNANVSFLYELPDGTVGNKASQPEGNSINIINMGLSNFKQLSIEEYLAIPGQKPNIEDINTINGSINIIKYHEIETAKTSSLEGQNLSGYKLIIHGVLKLVIEYTACEEEQSLHSAHYDIPFSTFIVLPNDYAIGNKVEVEGVVENIYSKAIDCRTLFTNSTILINAKILFC